MTGCARCYGGWRPVTEETVAKLAGPLVVPPDASPELTRTLIVEHDQRVASARNTVYPCKDCNVAAFYRWATGHYDPGHDRSTCEDCNPKAKPRGTTPTRPPETRRDLA